ncbi:MULTISPECIES: M20/M25/M40 family metallo-hydrolase [Anaeromyxobacter]|uniref:M20/M25/M40 family metallo-hydrolase n=1 Tax=Anaeromyxobacter TaxID=161492 RepID=UPI001F59B592|nr:MULTISPECIES: M20/M25/M40 family metallo-hydrolase [unclassified Anaeromyxobacter]
MRKLGRLALALALTACTARGAGHAAREPVIDPARALAEVAWLADPAREGRGVGTAGGAQAARWIADRFREAGLAPARDGGYLEEFEAPFRATLEARNALAIGRAPLALQRDFLPFGFSDDGTIEAELVFAGHGITAPELGHDDYAGLDVKGKIVLVAQDFPREADPASPFRDPRRYRFSEWRYKAMNARDHGAAAILGVRDVWAHEAPDELPRWRGQVASRAGLVAARVTAAALGRAGIDVAALAAPGEADGRPHSRPLGLRARLSVEVLHERAATANVVAILPGRDPAVADECVVVGAHHDHLGLGGDASLAPERLGTVHPGADDNASGVAALLAVARAFVAEGAPRRTVLFAAFAAEELGILGSSELAKDPPPRCPIGKMQLMVNLDMVGRPRGGKVYVDGADTAKGLRDRVVALAERSPRLPLRIAFGGGDGYGPSDHTSFYARGVPVLFLFTGPHADYHRPTDTADKIDGPGLAAVARLAYRAARDAAERDGRLEVVRTAAPPPRERGERSYGTYLGAIPDFAERAEPGVLLTGVRPGSPAERAGLAEGDVLLRLGAAKVMNLQDLAFALRSHRPGDEVEVEWAHGAERRTAKVKLEERR